MLLFDKHINYQDITDVKISIETFIPNSIQKSTRTGSHGTLETNYNDFSLEKIMAWQKYLNDPILGNQ